MNVIGICSNRKLEEFTAVVLLQLMHQIQQTRMLAAVVRIVDMRL